VSAVILWLAVFLPGLTINSQPYRDALLQGEFTAQNILLTLIAYTLTNTAILCCLAGMIGTAVHNLQKKSADTMPASMMTGVLRGFVIYLLLLAGVYAATPSPFNDTTPEQYVRMAGTVSLLAFLVNYEPNMFQSVINMSNTTEKGSKASG